MAFLAILHPERLRFEVLIPFVLGLVLAARLGAVKQKGSIAVWIILALLSPLLMYWAGVEFTLGPCFLVLCAPTGVKEAIHHRLENLTWLMLIPLGIFAGSLNLANMDLWKSPLVVWQVFVGGHLGKWLGVSIGAVVGWYATTRTATREDDIYQSSPLGYLIALPMSSSVNGAVAMIVVTMSGLKGLELQQATLGFFLTICAVFTEVGVIGVLIRCFRKQEK